MTSALEDLTTFYRYVARTVSAPVPVADQAALNALAARVDNGQLRLGLSVGGFEPGAAAAEVVKLSAGTTSVAVMAYTFFTGLAPTRAGLDYLVSPSGPNPNNLNSSYYQSFGIENRYINFAVNLGKLGEGQADFLADYGSLNLRQTAARAYIDIFGLIPAAAKLDSILDGLVPDGRGGLYSRTEYLAAYGRDGAEGVGTKAALVGWLLSEGAKTEQSHFSSGFNAYAGALGADAPYVDTYREVLGHGGFPAFAMMAHFSSEQSTDWVGLRAPWGYPAWGDNLNAGRWVLSGPGSDTITGIGVIAGLIHSGRGNDTVSINTLAASAGQVNGTETGTIRLGPGDDKLTITGALRGGAIVDGGSGDDTLTTVFGPQTGGSVPTIIRNVEHLVVAGVDPAAATVDLSAFTFKDVVLQTNGEFALMFGGQADRLYLEAGATTGGVTSITLGAGADVVRASRAGGFFNLHATDGVVDGYARITDFAKGVDRLDLGADERRGRPKRACRGSDQAGPGPGSGRRATGPRPDRRLRVRRRHLRLPPGPSFGSQLWRRPSPPGRRHRADRRNRRRAR